MRRLAGMTAVLIVATLGVGQAPPAAPDPLRDPIRRLPDQFGQATPKAALDSALKVIDRGRFDYLVAHLLDPAFVDARVAERTLRLEEGVEREFRLVRDRQRRDANLSRDERLPDDPAEFGRRVRAEAAQRAFRQLTADVRATLAENPDHVNDLRRFLRGGQLLEAGDTASFGLKDVKDRAVYLRKTAAGWHMEDRRTDAAAPK